MGGDKTVSGNYPEEKKTVPKLNAKDASYRVYRRKWQKQLQAHKVHRHIEKERETKKEEREEES